MAVVQIFSKLKYSMASSFYKYCLFTNFCKINYQRDPLCSKPSLGNFVSGSGSHFTFILDSDLDQDPELNTDSSPKQLFSAEALF